ncbi:MAG: BsaWI family type II restriction enzyme [Nitrososphaerales archaeon]
MTLPISDKEAQALRQSVGSQFEKNVAYIISDLLNNEGIYAISLKELQALAKKDKDFQQVLEFAKLPIRSPCDQRYEMVLPDTDVIVYSVQKDHAGNVLKRFHLATVSCKVSFHARQTESTFWALALRDHGTKFVLATEDKDDELKTCEMGNKTRRLLESYMNGVYMIKQYGNKQDELMKDIGRFYELFQRSKPSGYQRQDTKVFDEGRPQDRYCRQVRAFDDLLFDLMEWKFKFERP